MIEGAREAANQLAPEELIAALKREWIESRAHWRRASLERRQQEQLTQLGIQIGLAKAIRLVEGRYDAAELDKSSDVSGGPEVTA